MKKTIFPALAFLVLSSSSIALAQASGPSGWVNNEGCWCGYQTNLMRPYIVRGQGSSVDQRQATADTIEYWNRYVRLFDVQVDPGNELGGGNGVNEVNTFIQSGDSVARYGMELEGSLFGVAIMFPREGSNSPSFGAFNECKDFNPSGCGEFTESDVLINANFGTGWTADWFATGADRESQNQAVIQATALHEVGHTLGLHHIFSLPSSRSFSTMNYCNDDSGKFVTRIDAKTLRTIYPQLARDIVDIGVFNFVYGNEQYGATYAQPSATTLSKGETFSLNSWSGQNIGTRPAENAVVTFYLVPAGSRPYPEPSDPVLGSAQFGTVDVDAESEQNTSLAVPDSVAEGTYNIGAIATVNGQEDSPWEPGKPNNNRFLVGHGTPTAVTVQTGSGVSGNGGTSKTSLLAAFAVATNSPTSGAPVQFLDKSSGNPNSWDWNFGDSASGSENSSTAKDPSHTYSSPGTYSIRLTVRIGSGTNTVTKPITIGGGPAGGASQTLLIPIVLDVTGQGGAQFTSEVTLTNRGTTPTSVRLSYTAAAVLGGSGSGVVTETIGAGQQLVISDAISYLKSKGLAIGSGSQGGSLRAEFSGLSAGDVAFAGGRTSSPSGSGRAGLSYPGLKTSETSTGSAYLFGLRQTPADRTNLALVNAGTAGEIKLRVTLFSGNGSGQKFQFDSDPLGPGQWTQIGSVLQKGGFVNGFARIERISGSDPFIAYAVFNDNTTNDGSFVSAVRDADLKDSLVLPVIVETATFQSELVISNPNNEKVTAYVSYFESLASAPRYVGTAYIVLDPFQQEIFPGIVNELRLAGLPVGSRGPAYGGAVQVDFVAGATSLGSGQGGFAGARTGAPAGGGGQYGLFYPASPFSASASDAWIYGLKQNDSSRSNLALVNTGATNAPIVLKLEVYDGDTGRKASDQTLEPLVSGQWRQINGVLGSVRNGYVRVVRVSGSDEFQAYGVVNDGATSGAGTNDGSYVSMTKIQ